MGLITRQQAKDYMQLTTTVSDSLIDDYINLVSAEIEAYCDRRFDTVTYTEVINFKQSMLDLTTELPLNTTVNYPVVRLRQYPVQSLVSIVENTTTVSSDNYGLHSDNGVVEFFASVNDDKRKLVANYIAGYTTTTGSTYTVPYELQSVAKMGVKTLFENNSMAKSGAGNVKSKSLKDFSVSYGNDQSGLYVKDQNGELQKSYIAGNKSILDRYVHMEL